MRFDWWATGVMRRRKCGLILLIKQWPATLQWDLRFGCFLFFFFASSFYFPTSETGNRRRKGMARDGLHHRGKWRGRFLFFLFCVSVCVCVCVCVRAFLSFLFSAATWRCVETATRFDCDRQPAPFGARYPKPESSGPTRPGRGETKPSRHFSIRLVHIEWPGRRQQEELVNRSNQPATRSVHFRIGTHRTRSKRSSFRIRSLAASKTQ